MHMLRRKLNFLLIIHIPVLHLMSSENMDFELFAGHILDNINDTPSASKMSMAYLEMTYLYPLFCTSELFFYQNK